MASGFFVDVLLYDGQRMQSRSFESRGCAISTVIDMQGRAMVEHVSIIQARTGEVVHHEPSFAELARRVYGRQTQPA